MANNFKKLVVFDFNFDWNKYEATDKRYKDIDLVIALYKQAIQYQPVVISSSGWFGDCIDFINKTKIKDGYLVANAGAVIYDITNKKMLQTHYMNIDDVKSLVHHGIMMNSNMIISTISNKYAYISNEVTYQKIAKDFYSPCTIIKNYDDLNRILSEGNVVDIAFVTPFDTGKNSVQRLFQYNIERYFENEVHDLIVKANQSSPLVHFSSAKSTKLKALQNVMAYSNIEHLNDILYIAATCINRECYLHFKNTLISSNPDFIVEIAGAKQPKYITDEINNLTTDFGKETNSFWK